MPSSSPGVRALRAWLQASAAGSEHPEACGAAAAAAGPEPWQALAAATPLARARPGVAHQDLGLDLRLRTLPVDHPRAVVRVAAGAPCPALAPGQRKALGAFDTPRAMALRAVGLGIDAVQGPIRCGLDTACGTGTFLLAMQQAGVPEVHGEDLDLAALAVARVVAPGARLERRDGLEDGDEVDLVVGNPPFVPPELQDKALRRALRQRLPWLHGRFDLAVPFAWLCSQRLRPGGGLCLVLPSPLLVQPYGLELRRRWLAQHRFTALGRPEAFPGARVQVVVVALQAGAGPAPLPPHAVPAEEVLALPAVPLNARQRPGDTALLDRVRAVSVKLGELFEVDTGVVAHGPGHRRTELVHDQPGPGWLPFAEARDLRHGRRRWLDYQPERMHRSKRPALFEGAKLLVPRVVADRPLEVFVDPGGLWVGHTVNVLRPRVVGVPLEWVAELLRSPAMRAVLRLERGERLDVYPRDLRSLPVPARWRDLPGQPLQQAWGLDDPGWVRLLTLGA